MMNNVINFLSSKWNLIIFQCLMYFVVGYVMGEYLTWPKLILMFTMILGIQFITRIRGVADGMMMRQMMIDVECDTNEFLKLMKDQVDKINKKDLN